jgi:hypothetical protein
MKLLLDAPKYLHDAPSLRQPCVLLIFRIMFFVFSERGIFPSSRHVSETICKQMCSLVSCFSLHDIAGVNTWGFCLVWCALRTPGEGNPSTFWARARINEIIVICVVSPCCVSLAFSSVKYFIIRFKDNGIVYSFYFWVVEGGRLVQISPQGARGPTGVRGPKGPMEPIAPHCLNALICVYALTELSPRSML